MIIVSGENIYPSEIENHIYKFKGISLGVVSSIPDKLTQNKMIFFQEMRPTHFKHCYFLFSFIFI